MARCPMCGDVSQMTYTKWIEILALFAFAAGLLGGFWIGRGRLSEPVSTPFIQARVAGDPKCVAYVRYGVSAEKGCDATGDKWIDCTKEVAQ